MEKPDYDRMFEIENELCTKHDLSDEVLKLIFDYSSLKEKEGRYKGNMFPDERKPIDANYVIDRLECIIGIAECTTTGNLAHQRPNIICVAKNLISKIKEDNGGR
jgi:uncharacterized protein YmfQ (DUF2313 family)